MRASKLHSTLRSDSNIVISFGRTDAAHGCGLLPESGDEVPVLDWLVKLRKKDHRSYASCVAAVERLAALGHELRRPLADLLRDGIHELRIRKGRVNYRILYFFRGQGLAILGHAITKEDVVPDIEIERCLRRKRAFESNPEAHSYSE